MWAKEQSDSRHAPPGPSGSMRAQERSEPRHAQAERPNGTDICRVVPTERSGGRASAVSNTYWSSAHVPNKTPSGAKNPDRRGLDFDGNVLEIRSSRRTAACWRSCSGELPLHRSSLCSSSVLVVLVPCATGADPASNRVRLWRGGSASNLFFYLFFCSFVEYVDIDALTYLKAPGPYCGAEGRWRNVVLTVSASV